MREPVQVAGAIKVAQARDARGVGLRLEISPFGELRKEQVHFLDSGRGARPRRFGEHLIGSKLQAILALRKCEDIQNAAVVRRPLGAKVAEKLA